jgi:predicted ribosomally synthesized peptide with nif11-like leader
MIVVYALNICKKCVERRKMSTKSMTAFIEKVKQDKELLEKIKTLPMADTDTALAQGIRIAKEAGFDLSIADAQNMMAEYTGERELSDEELGQVAGGGNVKIANAGGTP